MRRDQGVLGKEVTPFVLQRVNDITEGQSLQSSILLNTCIHNDVIKYLFWEFHAQFKEVLDFVLKRNGTIFNL